MIKCSVCRKLPGDLSIFLSGFGISSGVTWEPLCAYIRPPRGFEGFSCMSMFLLCYYLNNGSNMLIPLMILIKLLVISLISYLIYLHLK